MQNQLNITGMCVSMCVTLCMIDIKKINFKPVNEATGVYVTLVNLLDIEPPYPRCL